ncbi:MAG: hypothetical protein ERJ67_01450 [Aphanocapsa feldmannii 277cV]|uniref:Uncharacterized protein n=2 Tax=Aphanocapsa feldmannii TaxID=192050 RepID=A0A524RQJ2_9CHRO|nr:MAG: hypothetical protein ERJ67_01450 [Aphanocapsa feldmannii 277cV]TGH22321.1 MAG: hypothetical protein ERJ68_04755 [Aphanocapsa feldmannii 277cI]
MPFVLALVEPPPASVQPARPSEVAPILAADADLPGDGNAAIELDLLDPVSQAQRLAASLPPRWQGTYRSFADGQTYPVELRIERALAIGQLVDFSGELTLAGVRSAIQGNLNASTGQLDLLPLAGPLPGGIAPGDVFFGTDLLRISAREGVHLADQGGVLALEPVSEEPDVRGLW